MEIKTLKDIQEHVNTVYFKNTKEPGVYTKQVYMCAPRKRKDEGYNYLYVLKGKIIFRTNAESRETGGYTFFIENREVLPKIGAKTICGINTSLAFINSEERCKMFPQYQREELCMEHKKVFTTLKEANEYIKNVKEGKINIEYLPVTVKTYHYENGEKILDSERTI